MNFSPLMTFLFGSTRRFFGGIALYTALMLFVGWFLQSWVGLVPCALCIIQRFFFAGVGAVALVGWLQPRFEKITVSLMLLLSLLGGGVALRNVYIQLVPQGLGSKCLPLLESITDWITVLFQATGDCSQRDWTLIGLSVPEWSLLSFLFLIGMSIWFLATQARSEAEKINEAS